MYIVHNCGVLLQGELRNDVNGNITYKEDTGWSEGEDNLTPNYFFDLVCVYEEEDKSNNNLEQEEKLTEKIIKL